jgi:glycogen synthase
LQIDRLISALNKYYRPITEKEFWFKMDSTMTQNAVIVSGFPKEVEEWVWKKERKPFEVF